MAIECVFVFAFLCEVQNMEGVMSILQPVLVYQPCCFWGMTFLKFLIKLKLY